jgi:LytS/YehU family sensor histidine kinase
MRRTGLFGVVVLCMGWLPLVALGVLAGIFFGWRVPVALALWNGVMFARRKQSSTEVGKLRATAEFVGLALLGAVVGGLLFGGIGVIVGLVLGFTMRLGEMSVTRGRSFNSLRRRAR